MSQGIKRLVLDVLKRHEPNIHELARSLSSIKGVDGVNISVVEFDQDTQSVKVTIEGDNVDLNHVEDTMRDSEAAIHSIDEVAAGKKLVERVLT